MSGFICNFVTLLAAQSPGMQRRKPHLFISYSYEMRLRLLLILALAAGMPSVFAQKFLKGNTGSQAVVAKNDSVKLAGKPTAWTLTTPLGNHQKASVDTLLYNYQRAFIPSFKSDAFATTGTLGAEGINMIYEKRNAPTTFFFDDALCYTLPSLKTFKFYNTFTPMTLASYNFGGNKQNHADRLNAIFAGNVNRNIGIGAFVDYNYSKGAYNAQAVKDFSFGFSVYYNTHRYEMQAMYYHFSALNKENGGITDDLYITDPAEVQGGVKKVEPKSIPVHLTTAHSRINGQRLFTTHAFKVGYWTEEQVNDTLTRDKYVPLMKFVYSLDYDWRHHMFRNDNATQGTEFWENTYFNPDGTDDNTRYWLVTNTVGVQLLEGFKKWAKFGIDAYFSLQNRKITLPHAYAPDLDEEQQAQLTPLPEGFSLPGVKTATRGFLGGSIAKRNGDLFKYSASFKLGLFGGVDGDLTLNGNASTRFRMLGDTVAISAYVGYSNTSNSWLLAHYASNHFIWDNSYANLKEFKFGGQLTIPWTRTSVSAGLRNIKDYVYFNDRSLPTQYGGNVQIFTLALEQKLKFGIWNWNNSITYQATSDSDVIPLPALSVYSNMFLDFRAFRVLQVQLGVDCNYYTRYYGLAYQPATMTFHTQHDVEVGNYAFCNAYFSAKLYKCRFYVLWSHVNQGWFGKNYFSLPHYPLNPRCLQFGLSVDFAN